MRIKANIVKFYENKKKPEVNSVIANKTNIMKEISNAISSDMENIKNIQIILTK